MNEPWETSYYIRQVWFWANEYQKMIEDESSHYLTKCEVRTALQNLKDSLREDLRTIKKYNE